jgi:hypothetical protein
MMTDGSLKSVPKGKISIWFGCVTTPPTILVGFTASASSVPGSRQRKALTGFYVILLPVIPMPLTATVECVFGFTRETMPVKWSSRPCAGTLSVRNKNEPSLTIDFTSLRPFNAADRNREKMPDSGV